MPKVTCYVTELNLMHSLPALDANVTIGGEPIAEHFQQASEIAGMPAVELTLDWSRINVPMPGLSYGADDGMLQAALAALFQTIPQSQEPQIGLILANFYSSAGAAYGYMFDLDFHSAAFGPRQGCAVFLKQIQNATGNDEQAFRDLVAFTMVHELGHCFNLWHIDEPTSFMKPPPYENLAAACGFVSDHKRYLQCAANPTEALFVIPGPLSSGFGTRVPGFDAPSDNGSNFSIPLPKSPIELHIQLSHSQFWHFEPVELEVELMVQQQHGGSVLIPKEIDPGYDRFEIWITRPDGELHRYRPSRRHCYNPEELEISSTMPYRRDIPIFLQSGGYTFPMPGRYVIEARLRFSGDYSLVSNKIECEVLKPRDDSAVFTALRDACSSIEAMKLLRYRSHLPHRADFARLADLAEKFPAHPTAATIEYSLGKVLLKAAATHREHAQGLREEGRQRLQSVMEHPIVGIHRRSVVASLIQGTNDDAHSHVGDRSVPGAHTKR
ncbi:hypothetical protein GMSM_44290 [Geomonas sp. Red276]